MNVKIEVVTFVYRMFFENKKNVIKKDVEHVLSIISSFILIDINWWTKWYNQLTNDSIDVDDILNFKSNKERTTTKFENSINSRKSINFRQKLTRNTKEQIRQLSNFDQVVTYANNFRFSFRRFFTNYVILQQHRMQRQREKQRRSNEFLQSITFSNNRARKTSFVFVTTKKTKYFTKSISSKRKINSIFTNLTSSLNRKILDFDSIFSFDRKVFEFRFNFFNQFSKRWNHLK